MRLCTICHRMAANSATSSQCRACHRAYMRQWRGPARITHKARARAWLRSGARTTAQLAALLGISRQHAATIRYQLTRERRAAEVLTDA